MKVGDLKTSLVDYFFKPVSPYPLAVFRILFGACACATLLLLHGDWGNWFGVHSWITMNTIAEAETGFRLNLFAIIPQDDRWIDSLYWIMLLASITLTLGVFTRVSSIITFLGLNSLNQRLPLILHGGDVFLRSAGFFLMFASSGTRCGSQTASQLIGREEFASGLTLAAASHSIPARNRLFGLFLVEGTGKFLVGWHRSLLCAPS
jgi:hypothetical protein